MGSVLKATVAFATALALIERTAAQNAAFAQCGRSRTKSIEIFVK
jgi:hypothetical protein